MIKIWHRARGCLASVCDGQEGSERGEALGVAVGISCVKVVGGSS